MSTPENSIPIEVLDAAIRGWFGTVPETKDQQQHFRHRMRAALAAAKWYAPAASDTRADRDAAFEAVRKRLCALPRYSFQIGDHGGVKRIEDRSGSWIDVDVAHELFDPVAVDAAIAAQRGQSSDLSKSNNRLKAE